MRRVVVVVAAAAMMRAAVLRVYGNYSFPYSDARFMFPRVSSGPVTLELLVMVNWPLIMYRRTYQVWMLVVPSRHDHVKQVANF